MENRELSATVYACFSRFAACREQPHRSRSCSIFYVSLLESSMPSIHVVMTLFPSLSSSSPPPLKHRLGITVVPVSIYSSVVTLAGKRIRTLTTEAADSGTRQSKWVAVAAKGTLCGRIVSD